MVKQTKRNKTLDFFFDVGPQDKILFKVISGVSIFLGVFSGGFIYGHIGHQGILASLFFVICSLVLCLLNHVPKKIRH